MTMASLIALGAPRLPEGQFYRVKRRWDGWTVVQVRRDSLFGSRLVSSAGMDRYRDPRTNEDVKEPVSFEVALVGAAWSAANHADTMTAESRWMGDHR